MSNWTLVYADDMLVYVDIFVSATINDPTDEIYNYLKSFRHLLIIHFLSVVFSSATILIYYSYLSDRNRINGRKDSNKLRYK